jgi:RalA-binding protein 1
VHAISGLLKLYLRELPASILTSERRDDFVKITEIEDKNEKITALNNLVHSLPEANFALLKALSGHLLRIVDNSDVNKMTIRNVGIVFSPTLNIPAQVFSMFLHEYRYIFFRDADGNVPALAPAAASPLPQPPRSPMPPMIQSPRTQNFEFPERRMMEPPRTPMLPSHPAAIRPPGMAQQTIAYEPNYDNQPQISSPTFNSNRFGEIAPSSDSSSGTSLAVPGADAKSNKSRRRESSMMFMMGGLKKSSFQKSNNGKPAQHPFPI